MENDAWIQHKVHVGRERDRASQGSMAALAANWMGKSANCLARGTVENPNDDRSDFREGTLD